MLGVGRLIVLCPEGQMEFALPQVILCLLYTSNQLMQSPDGAALIDRINKTMNGR